MTMNHSLLNKFVSSKSSSSLCSEQRIGIVDMPGNEEKETILFFFPANSENNLLKQIGRLHFCFSSCRLKFKDIINDGGIGMCKKENDLRSSNSLPLSFSILACDSLDIQEKIQSFQVLPK